MQVTASAKDAATVLAILCCRPTEAPVVPDAALPLRTVLTLHEVSEGDWLQNENSAFSCHALCLPGSYAAPAFLRWCGSLPSFCSVFGAEFCSEPN